MLTIVGLSVVARYSTVSSLPSPSVYVAVMRKVPG